MYPQDQWCRHTPSREPCAERTVRAIVLTSDAKRRVKTDSSERSERRHATSERSERVCVARRNEANECLGCCDDRPTRRARQRERVTNSANL